MLKKIVSVIAISSMLALTACANKTGITEVDNAVAKVQAEVLKKCSYVVYADAILKILNAAGVSTPNTSQVVTWTGQICAAVAPAPASAARTFFSASPTITVKGTVIPITGYFM